jgi:uncharacterized iron-regulated membrane protein
MHTEASGLSNFFGVVTRFHRWFNIEGDNRAMARQITGVANVIFLFLVLSGMYLWLPAIWQKALFKARLWLRKDYPNAKVRDFHWHHIFGIWMAIPLIAVVYSGMVISYPWAANFMYRVFGAEVPVQQQAAGPTSNGAPQAAAIAGSVAAVAAGPQWKSMDELIVAALADDASAGWKRFTLTLPPADAHQVQIEIDHGNGAQAQLRHTLSLDRATGAIVGRRGFADQPEAQRLRSIARFLHTGEALGLVGQLGRPAFAAIAQFAEDGSQLRLPLGDGLRLEQHAAFDFRMPVAGFLAGATQRHALHHRDVVFQHAGFTNDDASGVIDEDAGTDMSGRVDVDGKHFTDLALQPQRHAVALLQP